MKDFEKLKEKIAQLKGSRYKFDNMVMEIDPPFIDDMLAKPILDKF